MASLARFRAAVPAWDETEQPLTALKDTGTMRAKTRVEVEEAIGGADWLCAGDRASRITLRRHGRPNHDAQLRAGQGSSPPAPQ
jgi:hypothetical protein